MTTDDIEALSKSIIFVFYFCSHALQKFWNTAWDAFLVHPMTQKWGLQALTVYSRISIQLELWYRDYVFPWFPEKDAAACAKWTLVSTLNRKLEYSEIVLHNTDQAFDVKDRDELFDFVIMTKKEESPLVQVKTCCTTTTIDSHAPLQESLAHFLAITYHHPELEASIPLEVSEEMMVVDNELLSPAFVRRALNTVAPSAPFDDRYWIECIDQSIVFTKLNSNQYLLLIENGGYLVVKRTKTN